MTVSVIGCGRWGACIAWYLDKLGNTVTVFGPKEAPELEAFKKTRTNGTVTFPESITLTNSLEEAMVLNVCVWKVLIIF